MFSRVLNSGIIVIVESYFIQSYLFISQKSVMYYCTACTVGSHYIWRSLYLVIIIFGGHYIWRYRQKLSFLHDCFMIQLMVLTLLKPSTT